MKTKTTTNAFFLLAVLFLPGTPGAAQEQASADRPAATPATAEANAQTADSDAEATAAARRERLRRLRYGNLAELELAGKQIRISYPDLATGTDDHRALEALEPGQVAAWTSARAIKLLTHASLSFGGVVVPYGNVSPDYPGVYSLWPKRTASGWSLVFNGDADIWGSQRNAAADAVEAPLEHSTADEPAEKLTIEFLEAAGKKVLRIAWGDHQFLAAFEAVP